MQRAIAALAVAFALASPAAAQEPVTLRWKPAKGDRMMLTSELRTTSKTVAEGPGAPAQKETEEDRETRTYVVEVSGVREDGGCDLVLTLNMIDKRSRSEKRTLRLKAARKPDGKVDVDVEFTLPKGQAGQVDMKPFFEKLVRNMLEVKLRVKVGPRGRTVSVKAEGDLFEGIPAEDPVSAMALTLMKRIVSLEDFEKQVTGFTFPLPEQEVAAGGTWPVKHALFVKGMWLEGEGTSRLKAVERTDAGRSATIDQEVTYVLDAARFNRRMEERMNSIFEPMGVKVGVECDFRAKEKVVVRAANRFDLGRGYPGASAFKGVKVGITGDMRLEVQGQVKPVEMTIDAEMDLSFRWAPLR